MVMRRGSPAPLQQQEGEAGAARFAPPSYRLSRHSVFRPRPVITGPGSTVIQRQSPVTGQGPVRRTRRKQACSWLHPPTVCAAPTLGTKGQPVHRSSNLPGLLMQAPQNRNMDQFGACAAQFLIPPSPPFLSPSPFFPPRPPLFFPSLFLSPLSPRYIEPLRSICGGSLPPPTPLLAPRG